MIFAPSIAVLFGAYEQDGTHFFFSIPEIVFEVGITIYTLVKGFRPSPVLEAHLAGRARTAGTGP